MTRHVAWIVPVCLGISACQVDTRDLEQFVHPSLPPPSLESADTPAPSASAAATGNNRPSIRDPFQPHPDTRRKTVVRLAEPHPHEPLEAYPLNTLHWVGTLKQADRLWALIQTHEGTIHRITAGSRLGENGGQLIAIEPARLSIAETEWLEDGTRQVYMKYIDRQRNHE